MCLNTCTKRALKFSGFKIVVRPQKCIYRINAPSSNVVFLNKSNKKGHSSQKGQREKKIIIKQELDMFWVCLVYVFKQQFLIFLKIRVM